MVLALTSVWHSLLSVVLAYTSLITVLRERLAEIFTLNSVVTSIYNDGASLCVYSTVYGILIWLGLQCRCTTSDVHMPCVIRISHESHDAWSLDGRRVFLRSGDGDRFNLYSIYSLSRIFAAGLHGLALAHAIVYETRPSRRPSATQTQARDNTHAVQ